MATLCFTNAKIVLDGTDLSGDCNEGTISQTVEMLDETAFGDDTRTRKGGLTMTKVDISGFVTLGSSGPEAITFNAIGNEGVLTIFPEKPTEGEACGFSHQEMGASFQTGVAVGTILPFSASFEGRGTEV